MAKLTIMNSVYNLSLMIIVTTDSLSFAFLGGIAFRRPSTVAYCNMHIILTPLTELLTMSCLFCPHSSKCSPQYPPNTNTVTDNIPQPSKTGKVYIFAQMALHKGCGTVPSGIKIMQPPTS
jgi:hypothetical protein